jgi:hypothetical protein
MSKLFVDDIVEKTSGHGVQIAGLVPAAGSVAQVVSNFITTDVNTASTSFVSTGLSASITPASTSNKVFVIASSPSWYVSTDNAYATVYRDSTNIGNSSYGLMMVYADAKYAPSTMQVLDAPSSTSSLTYTVYFRSVTGSTTYISYPTYGQFTITLMEIAQ